MNDFRTMDLQKLMDKALYGEDDSLEGHVSRETFGLIRKKDETWGLPLKLIVKQRLEF